MFGEVDVDHVAVFRLMAEAGSWLSRKLPSRPLHVGAGEAGISVYVKNPPPLGLAVCL